MHLGGVLLPVFEGKGHAVALLPDVQRAHVRVLIAEAEPDGADVVRQLCFAQEGVVAVEHQRRAVFQARADLQLCLADVLLAAQIADVGHADAGDDAHIRPGTLGEPLDLAQMAHAHLHHGVLRLFADAEHGAGQAQLVVLVALGLDGIAKARDGGVGHLFRGGLAHAARHAHHLGVELAAVVGAHGHHGAVAVRAEDGLLRRDAVHRVVEHDVRRALVDGFCSEIVAVELLARERHEDAARPHLAAVRRHQIDARLVREARRGQAVQQNLCRNLIHKYAPIQKPLRHLR